MLINVISKHLLCLLCLAKKRKNKPLLCLLCLANNKKNVGHADSENSNLDSEYYMEYSVPQVNLEPSKSLLNGAFPRHCAHSKGHRAIQLVVDTHSKGRDTGIHRKAALDTAGLLEDLF